MARKTKDDTASKIKRKEVVEKVVVEKPKRTMATKKKVEEPKPIIIDNVPAKKRTRKKKVTEAVEKVENVMSPIPKKKLVNKDKTVIETVSPKKKTRKVITENPMKDVKDEIKPKKVHKTNDDIIIEPPKKRTRRKKEEEPKSKLPSTPPIVEKVTEEHKKVEPPKSKVRKVSEPKKPKKLILKVKDFYEFEEGKYVLGDVEELFDEKLLKKMKTSIKKLSKKNHGKDDKLGIHYFKVGDKVWDFIEYNSKILTASNSLILCKSETVTKEGKLRFCKRFEAKEKFNVFVDYTKEDYCLYFYYDDEPSPFMMLQEESPV